MSKENKTHAELIEILGKECIRKEKEKAQKKGIKLHPYQETSYGYAAIARAVNTSREAVSRWHSRNSVPKWRWPELEKLSPLVGKGAFEQARKST